MIVIVMVINVQYRDKNSDYSWVWNSVIERLPSICKALGTHIPQKAVIKAHLFYLSSKNQKHRLPSKHED
jgi:hypothetical protein